MHSLCVTSSSVSLWGNSLFIHFLFWSELQSGFVFRSRRFKRFNSRHDLFGVSTVVHTGLSERQLDSHPGVRQNLQNKCHELKTYTSKENTAAFFLAFFLCPGNKMVLLLFVLQPTLLLTKPTPQSGLI